MAVVVVMLHRLTHWPSAPAAPPTAPDDPAAAPPPPFPPPPAAPDVWRPPGPVGKLCPDGQGHTPDEVDVGWCARCGRQLPGFPAGRPGGPTVAELLARTAAIGPAVHIPTEDL